MRAEEVANDESIRAEIRESRWEAAPAVAITMGLQLTLALVSRLESWTTWKFQWWVWLIPVPAELALLIALAWSRPHRALVQLGIRREAALTLLGLISAANAVLVLAVIGSLVSGHEASGGQLLLKAFMVWGTNVITFGLWYWALDRGGPIRRRRPNPPLPDFRFPQMEDPALAPRAWQPQLFDYVYVSFTNSIAFSPTDAMPLTRWAKVLMMSESAISALTVLLVAARAVNIFIS